MKHCRISLFWVFLAVGLFFLGSCKVKKPHFKRIDNVKVVSLAPTKIGISADLILHNPNSLSFTLKSIDVDVFSNKNEKLTSIKQIVDIKMPGRADFSVPVHLAVNPLKVLATTSSLMGSLISALKTQEMEFLFKGTCKVEKSGIGFNVPIDTKGTIKLDGSF